jgi:hypothetical protein
VYMRQSPRLDIPGQHMHSKFRIVRAALLRRRLADTRNSVMSAVPPNLQARNRPHRRLPKPQKIPFEWLAWARSLESVATA